ncbi:MAG: hypothetical protein Q8O26_02885 [Phreatobacter sp.]|uniref:hypothetical protein n=1 Tax=Phreatobacter sp. TaxID=1966341 RepID=UPI002736757A|nr:hypothetical protein [Phreatobacter sp.]MDP2800806.1 hypothetical protein [Phreatobacter sp.]
MSQVRLLQSTGPASAAGTVLTSQTPTETAAWVEVPAVTAAIPSGGAQIEITANAGAMRVAILRPGHNITNPLNNGHLIASGAVYRDALAAGSRVFIKLP